ncbi:MAG: CBS domain-containing protein [Gemmatimonadota bacterium]
MSLEAGDIMNADVVVARDTMTVHQLALLLQSNQVSGVPVLDAGDRLVGVVSASDIILTDEAFGQEPLLESDYHSQVSDQDAAELDGLDVSDRGDALVRDIMSTSVITAEATAPVAHLAELMYTHHIHRIIIVDRGELAGIVSTMDILKAVMDGIVA